MNIRIALAQINSTVGDLRGNAAKILNAIHRAKREGAHLILFPEMALTGYPPEDLILKPYFIAENIKILKDLASYVHNIFAIIGFADHDRKSIYNAAALVGRSRILGTYHKIFLPNYGIFDEQRYFAPGQKQFIFSLGGIRFGINICEDIWHPKSTWALAGGGKAQVIMCLNSSPYHSQKWKAREKTIIPQIHVHKPAVVYVNMVGGQDEVVFDGGSMVFNTEGKVVARAPQFKEDLIFVDTEKLKLKSPKGLATIAALELKTPEHAQPVLPRVKAAILDPLEEIYEALVLGTRDYLSKNNFKKAAVALSGGIDSALTVAIAVDALGKDNVIGVSLPSPYTSNESKQDAELLANNLGITFKTFPIQEIMEAYAKDFEVEFQGLAPDITEENLQARIRGNIMMALSNKFGYLLLATGNKSEMSVGYATLYGDMAGGFALIKDVPKTLVYKLADYRNKKANTDLIPQRILTKAPTAELKPGQKDQDTLPPYDTLDAILQAYIMDGKSAPEIIRSGMKEEMVLKVINMVDKSEYKRRQAPPGIKITPKAFGRDRRMPITNGFRLTPL